jgi:hypothetical protein
MLYIEQFGRGDNLVTIPRMVWSLWRTCKDNIRWVHEMLSATCLLWNSNMKSIIKHGDEVFKIITSSELTYDLTVDRNMWIGFQQNRGAHFCRLKLLVL